MEPSKGIISGDLSLEYPNRTEAAQLMSLDGIWILRV